MVLMWLKQRDQFWLYSTLDACYCGLCKQLLTCVGGCRWYLQWDSLTVSLRWSDSVSPLVKCSWFCRWTDRGWTCIFISDLSFVSLLGGDKWQYLVCYRWWKVSSVWLLNNNKRRHIKCCLFNCSVRSMSGFAHLEESTHQKMPPVVTVHTSPYKTTHECTGGECVYPYWCLSHVD